VPTIFVYDGHAGGAGFAERGYEKARVWLSATRDAIKACECESGCPSCVQSPKCGNKNNPLDKDAAVTLINVLLKDASDFMETGTEPGSIGPTSDAPGRATVGPPATAVP
jgi:DEAD/DEAH box helicase domain-containing protein